LVIEPTGDDNLSLTCSSWDDAKIILADETLQVVGVGKVAYLVRSDRPLEYLDVDHTGLAAAGYGEAVK
jgi:hypothetical protein